MKLRCLIPLVASVLAAAPSLAKTLTIGVDLSESNPVISSENFAKAAAGRVRAEIAALQLGDYVHVRRFGERGADGMQVETLRITRQSRANAVADKVARYIAALPAKTPGGQKETQIVAFLEFASRLDCKNNGRVLLLTDGIEHSPYITGRQFLSGKPLPVPEPNILRGCAVEMWGFGQAKDGSLPPAAIKTIRAAWAAWMKEAGASFTAIIDP